MIIGITTTYTNLDDLPIERVRVEYLHSVERAGGIALFLPPTHLSAAIDEMLARIDGLLLTGGGDIDPAWYTDEATFEQVSAVSHKRDEFEIALAKRAHEMSLPTFGICRGMQIMNIAFGGSLFQDLIASDTTEVNHMQTPPFDNQEQGVELIAQTKLASLFNNAAEIKTNSMHHQGIRTAAPNFRINATSVDGVVEGIEDASKAFYLGVQWHPEYLADNDVLFEAFCAQAQGFRRD